MMKNTVSVLLLAAALASVFCSCGGEAETPVTTEATGEITADSVTTEDPDPFEKDTLPAGLDFGGQEIHITYRGNRNEFSEKETGEIIGDTEYKRQLNIEDRLNVDIVNSEIVYDNGDWSIFQNTVKASVMAEDGSYDLISGQYTRMADLVLTGCLLNLGAQKYLDFTKPWWAKGLIEDSTIDGKLYLVTGDISIDTMKECGCIFFNKRLAADYDLENLYDVVLEGNWTYEKMLENLTGVYRDLNGDGKSGKEDQFGLVMTSSNCLILFEPAFRLPVVKMNNGMPELCCGTERMHKAVEMLCDMTHTNPDVRMTDSVNDNRVMFREGNALFHTSTFAVAASVLNDMEDDFGILPFPKFDAEQDQYYTGLSESCTLFAITTSTKDPGCASAVMEALASENYRTLAPVVYEVALKVKYSRDEESAKMYDIIKENVVIDFGWIYGGSLGWNFASGFRDYIKSNKKDWMSYYESRYAAAVKGIDKFCETIKGLD